MSAFDPTPSPDEDPIDRYAGAAARAKAAGVDTAPASLATADACGVSCAGGKAASLGGADGLGDAATGGVGRVVDPTGACSRGVTAAEGAAGRDRMTGVSAGSAETTPGTG